MSERRRFIDTVESDFNARLRSIAVLGRHLEQEIERFLEHHGTDCTCDVCADRAGSNMTPAEVCDEVKFVSDFLRRAVPKLEDAVVTPPYSPD